MRLLVAAHFRHSRVRHVRRFPKRGPALVVANHPSAWADVVILHVTFDRKLHFLAGEELFRPAPRGWLLRLFGSLPVVPTRGDPEHAARNAETFRRCGEWLARGEVIAVFPEGVSGGDRSLGQFHAGAARIALDRLTRGGCLPIVPVGLHYGDRTAFRDDVVVSVGRPIRLDPSMRPDLSRVEEWVAALTERLEEAVAHLIVDLPDERAREVVEELAPFLGPGAGGDPARYRRSRRLARRLRPCGDPNRWSGLGRRADLVRTIRTRMRIERHHLDVRTTASSRRLVALGSPLAVAGAAVNAPIILATMLTLRWVRNATRVAFAGMLAGLMSVVLWYASIVSISRASGHGGGRGLLVIAFAAALGAFAIAWSDALLGIRGAHARAAIRRLMRRTRSPVDRELA